MTTIAGVDDSYDEINKPNGFRGGVKIWRNADGELHRDGDLPAVIYVSGAMFYYKNGKRHCDSGLPAVIKADGSVEYWIDGVKQK